MRFLSTDMKDRNMLFAAIPSICASSPKKISIYNEEMIVARCFIGSPSRQKGRSRKKKINFGLNQQPDCVVILNADRKSSVILEADRSQIPIPSLVDSTIPRESHKRITYPIPANDPIQFVYLFRHSIMKTVILEQNATQAKSIQKRIDSTGRNSSAPITGFHRVGGSSRRLLPQIYFRRSASTSSLGIPIQSADFERSVERS